MQEANVEVSSEFADSEANLWIVPDLTLLQDIHNFCLCISLLQYEFNSFRLLNTIMIIS